MIDQRQLIFDALKGGALARNPVMTPYYALLYEDRWTQLTGEPVEEYYRWMLKPWDHGPYYRLFAEKIPMDVFHPARWRAGKTSYEYYERTEIIKNDKGIFAYDKKDGTYEPLPENPYDDSGGPVEKQIVFDRNDADELITIESAESQIEQGVGACISECARALGDERFIMSAGIMNVFYYASWYVGLTNLFYLIVDKPDLMEYIFKRLLEKNIERIRMIAKSGGDAVYIDDATASNDMISTDMYERFSLPYMKAQVDEIHSMGKKAFVIYFGGIADRVEQIVSTGADALIMECSMKGYTNDYDSIAGTIDDRLCVCTNIDPVTEFMGSDDDEFRKTVEGYAALAKRHRKYIISTGSPVTPDTPLERILFFIEVARDA